MDLSDTLIRDQKGETDSQPDTIGKMSKNTDTRDNSTLRLRQMVAFRRQSNRQIGGKDEKMIQRLQPYLNRFRITTQSENSHKTINKVREVA